MRTNLLNQPGKLLLLLAIVATALSYINGLQYPFVFDDPVQIVNNPAVHSWRFVPKYFTSDVWPETDSHIVGTFYRPVFQMWLLLNYKIAGLNTVGWHITSILLHLLVTASVFVLASMLANDEVIGGIAALLFGVHPVHVEVVTWISGVTEPLMAIFFVTALICYLKYRQTKNKKVWLVSSLLLYLFALFSKETAVMLPVIIVVYELLLRSSDDDAESRSTLGRIANALRDVFPYIVLTVAYMAGRYLALKGLMNTLTALPVTTLIYTWPSVLLFYVRLLVWPFGLSAYYDIPYVTGVGFQTTLIPLFILVTLGVGLYLASKRNRLIAFLSLWMLLLILPVLNLSVFKEGEIAHDRYLYLPSFGFCVIAAIAIRKVNLGSQKVFGQPLSQIILVLLIAALFAVVTARQNTFWSSELALSARGVEIAPGHSMAATNLATELALRGDYQRAIPLFRQAIDHRPNYWLPTFNLGYVYYRMGNLREAEHFLRRGIQLSPSAGAQYRFLGFTLLEMGRKAEAEESLRKAISLQPDAPEQHYALGTVLEERKDFAGALQAFQMEANVNPKNPNIKKKIAELKKMIDERPRQNQER